ncbi:Gfo/Idh/MocA family oxidoreductase [Pseudaestuariivita atlantica]|uniref:Oxidoreductase n=1 Tax=Pseudaestuariivita atlantica TaxID=1317121 RepID=A0A0L1JP81_9RHOB|nr:Gfo/Idh/MocA family oxidoreductase [Pseudaestuariivita atlantica]KNG93536.1 oxidoreductase [Pseudaestuariivita atlantica]
MSPIRSAVIGAGYIADWHAGAIRATPGVDLVAVCDASPEAAQGFAATYGVEAFGSVEDMAASGRVDAVHITTPPQVHRDIAVECLEAGLHVLVEKPVAVSAAETADIVAASDASGKLFAAGHNFMGTPGYRRLKAALARGKIGRVAQADIRWCFPLGPLRAGPYGIWLMREPRNLLLELGPHLYGFAVDLFGEVEVLHLDISNPVDIPGDSWRPQTWRILARAGGVDVTLTLSLVETYDDRSLTLTGSGGMARYDYANDVLTFGRENAADLIVNPFLREMGAAWQHLREGGVNVVRQTASLNRKSAYGVSFRGLAEEFYAAIREGRPLDARFSGATALSVMTALDATLDRLPAELATPFVPPKASRAPKPSAVVIGGTGFIGQALTRALAASGTDVRVLSRGTRGPFADLPDQVETVAVSLRDEAALTEAMQGTQVVYNLARSLERTWEAALANDVGVSDTIARAAQAAGVERFVFTGTIASYDMSDPAVTITEDTGFAEDMTDRNMYARSKAECERRLMRMFAAGDLPLTIARPGIVVGRGGPLQHWGIGRWHGAGAVRIWGHGRNILPFVLNDDVADGLIRMGSDEASLGESFNLVGDPMWTARDYFDEIHRQLGARITVRPGNLTALFAAERVKYVLKRHALGRADALKASRRDWQSRAHFSPFDNAKPKKLLGWQPVADRAEFARIAINEANLLGF